MNNTAKPSLKPVVIATLSYLSIAILFAFTRGNWEFVFYIAVVILLGLAVVGVHKHVGLTKATLWCLCIWGLLHMVGGLVSIPFGLPYHGDTPVFYSLWIIPNYFKYDHAVHAFGFGICTWICWQALRGALENKHPRWGVLILCWLGGMGLGCINEIVESVAVLLIPATNVGGYINTGWDLVANAVGASVAAVLIAYAGKND